MVPPGTSYRFSVGGYSGGWFAWGTDTVQELRDRVTAGIGAQLELVSLGLDAATDLGARVGSNSFPYLADVVIRTTVPYAAPDDVKAIVRGVFWNSSTQRPTISNVSLGEGAQPEPPGSPLDNLPIMLTMAAIVVVGVVVLSVRR